MQAALDRYLDASPEIRGGKPRIAGTRVTVSDIVLMHLRLGQSLEQIAAKYDLSMSAVHAAMAFYHDHRGEIGRSIDEEDAYIQAACDKNPSLLQAKVRALSGG